MRETTLKSLLLMSVSCGALSVTAPVFAQDEEGTAVEEITVSARRRDESLQDVPIAVTAISGDLTQKINLENIVEIGKIAPNVTLEVSRGTNTTITAFIRGVGQQDPVAGFEAGVGIYLDDVYLNRPQGAVLELFDLERVEVLRGPQGTLYGRNTIGGAIKYVTKRLNPDEVEGQVRLRAGTYGQADVIGKVSVPVTDTLRIGAALASMNRGGFGDNLADTDGIDNHNYNKELWAARASLEWEPNQDFFLRIAGDYLEDDSDPRQGHRLIPSNFGDPVLDNVFDTRAGLEGIDQKVEWGGISATAEYTINDNWAVKNILAYRQDESTSPIDFDSLPQADVDVPVIYENDQFSEEFQVLYNSEKLNGLFGFYFLEANASNAFDVLLGTTGDLIGLPGLNAQTFGDVNTTTWALFADLTYQITDELSISYGGRYTSDDRESTILRRTFIGGFSETFGGAGVPIATTSDFNGSNRFEEYQNRVSISYTPRDDISMYASYSEGFKGGGFDPRGQTTGAPDLDGDGVVSGEDIFNFLSFEPEEVTTYEVGVKGYLFEGRFSYAFAAFHSDYTNVQIPGSVGLDTDGDGVNDTFTGITSNAASATISGIEYEGNARLFEDATGIGDTLDLSWTFGYLDASFDEFVDAFGVDVADQRVFQNTPEITYSTRLTYSRDFDFLGIQGTFDFLNMISGRSRASQFETPNRFLDQPAFALWDASIVWTTEDGKYQFGVHAKNITDERYIVAGYNFVNANLQPTLGQAGTLTGFYGDPATVTAQFSYNF